MKYLPKVLVFTLLTGVAFAFYTLYTEFVYFAEIEGTIVKFNDCAVTNPILTPCFFGAVAFWIAFVWSVIIILKKTVQDKLKEQKHLLVLLLGGTIFAWSNFGYTVFKYLNKQDNFGCSITPIEHPLESSCFIGAIIYLVALALGVYCKKYYTKLLKGTTSSNSSVEK